MTLRSRDDLILISKAGNKIWLNGVKLLSYCIGTSRNIKKVVRGRREDWPFAGFPFPSPHMALGF